MQYDAVIIGAGPSGLAAAARLSHFGVSVCLLEAHNRLGGLSSWHHVRGREISSGLHAFTNFSKDGKGGPLGKLLRQLRMKYSDLELREQGSSSIHFPSATLRFSNDPEYFRSQVAERFPDEIDGFDRFRARILETDEGELTTLQQSARDVMARHIRDPLLIDMLFCPVMFYGNPGGVGDGLDAQRTSPDMDWLLFCVIWKCIFETGLGYPADGIRPLWEALARRVTEDGGVIRMASRVTGLKSTGGRISAALLESGEEIEGGIFLSSAGGRETQELLGAADVRPKIPAGPISVVEGICLLDCTAVDAGMTDTVTFYSFNDVFRFGRPAGIVEDSCGLICAPGNYRPAAGPAENLLKLSQLASYPVWAALEPKAYVFAKHETAAGMSRALGELGIAPIKAKDAPGKFAVWDDIFTPMTLCRYASHDEGALYGSTVKSRSGATPFSNLFLIGADQGFHGIVGAMLSGVAMANIHLLAKRGG